MQQSTTTDFRVITSNFFDQDASSVARALLGKVIRSKYNNLWLAAQIIETEAYYLHEKGSHSSLGFTQKRKALFMPPGTIYMYYARGGDSLNFSCQGEGNAVLIKSAIVYQDALSNEESLRIMQELNPMPGLRERPLHLLCSGQVLLCRSLNLKVPDWNQKNLDIDNFYLEDVGYKPAIIGHATRRGIPPGRDEHLLLRFYDSLHIRSVSK